MTILSDHEIKTLCTASVCGTHKPMISPFSAEQTNEGLRKLTPQETLPYRGGLLSVQGQLIDRNSHQRASRRLPRVVIDEDLGLALKQRTVSHGLSSYGYDVRIAPEFKIFTNVSNSVLDPKAVDEDSFVDFEGDVCIVPPNSFVLARTLEYFNMPKNVTGLVTSKSTYARLGVNVLTTVIEAGWHGELVLEFANLTPLPVKLYANEGAAQVLFFKGDVCDTPYDEFRKYQGQTGITLARM